MAEWDDLVRFEVVEVLTSAEAAAAAARRRWRRTAGPPLRFAPEPP